MNPADTAREENIRLWAEHEPARGTLNSDVAYLLGLLDAARARVAEVRDEYEAWNTEGLGTCPELNMTNYPDAWAGVGCALTRDLAVG